MTTIACIDFSGFFLAQSKETDTGIFFSNSPQGEKKKKVVNMDSYQHTPESSAKTVKYFIGIRLKNPPFLFQHSLS